MSLGWLQENTFTKRAAKPIQGVQQGAVVDLKAALYSAESDLRGGTRASRSKFLPLDAARTDALGGSAGASVNAGVASRRARDEAAHAAMAAAAGGGPAHLRASAAHLAHKAALYDAIVSGGVGAEGSAGTFLVDFERKGWQHVDAQSADATERRPLHAQQRLELDAAASSSAAAAAASFSSALAVARPASPDPSDLLAGRRADWERAALSALSASSASARELALKPPSAADPADAARRALLLDGAAAASTEGMSAREKHALERRKRKAVVALRRDMLREKEVRKEAFAAALRAQQPQPHSGWVPVQ